MARIVHIPFDIIRLIIIRLVSPSVESLDDWANSMKVLAVSRMWRSIGEPLLYANIVISLETYHNDMITFHSNLELVVDNHFENHVRATIVHIAPNISRHEAVAAFYWHMPNNLTTALNRPGAMRRFWRMIHSPTLLTSGACIEPLLLTMPNLRYFFVESHFMSDPWMESISVFLNYSVASQSSYRIDISAFNDVTEFDFIAHYKARVIPALDTQTAMTRMVLAPSSEQTLATSHKRFVPSTDCVQFCAEYIRRLRILDLPESALNLGTSVDVLRNRNPCPPEENYMRRPWYNFRFRSFICVQNICFENSMGGVTRYELFAFNRNANDHMLQISASMPAEVSDIAQLLDNSSDNASDSDSA